jgi:murein DD-endopeptidase MepM/ murein hydrolase activator NlpD
MKMLLYTLIFIFSACSSREGIISKPIEIVKIEKPFNLKTLLLPVGNVERVKFYFKDAQRAKVIRCVDKVIPFEIIGSDLIFFIRESYFSNLNPYDCKLEYENEQKNIVVATIVSVVPQAREFKEEKLTVDSKKVELSKKDSARVLKEQLMLNELYLVSNPSMFSHDDFGFPMRSQLTSIYGTKRVFNGVRQTQHLGNDFKAKVGDTVFASNKGKVVLVRDLFYSGQTVILDHGLGVFTIYAHLSKIFVREGVIVSRGQKIADSGTTGRVTGPHLHWGVKIHGEWVDGLSLVKTTMPN